MAVTTTTPDLEPAAGATGRPLCVAHRGASASAPENTLAALRVAAAHGADLVEVDVQRSRDGALVLVHDTTLVRTTDVRRVFGRRRAPWLVSDFTLEEIRRLDAGSWKSPAFEGEPVPTLGEALDVVRASGTGLLLELKAPALYPGIVAEVAAELFAGRPGGTLPGRRVVVESFDASAVRELKARVPHATVGLLGRPHPSGLAELAGWADQVNPNHRAVSRSYVAAVHDAGLECLLWTVNATSALLRAVASDADGIITDHPLLLRGLLSEQLAGSTARG